MFLWRVWLVFTLGLVFVQIPGLGAFHSSRVLLCVGALIALVIGSVITPARRVRLAGLGVVISVLGVSEAVRYAISELPWLFIWGAWWDVAGWWFLVLAASLCFVQAKRKDSTLAWSCLLILAVNLVFVALDRFSIYSRWMSAPGNPGLFPSENAWAAWCVILMPILWGKSRLASIPCVIGLVLSASSSACIVFCLWLIARLRRSFALWFFLVLAGLAFYLFFKEPDLFIAIKYRVRTWQVVLRVIFENPFGIGWGFGAYNEVLLKAHAPVLPHPASDWLMFVLRYGWWSGIVLVFSSLWLWTRKATPEIEALRIAWALAAIQSSISIPVVGAVVWLIYLNFKMESKDEEKSINTSCGSGVSSAPAS